MSSRQSLKRAAVLASWRGATAIGRTAGVTPFCAATLVGMLLSLRDGNARQALARVRHPELVELLLNAGVEAERVRPMVELAADYLAQIAAEEDAAEEEFPERETPITRRAG